MITWCDDQLVIITKHTPVAWSYKHLNPVYIKSAYSLSVFFMCYEPAVWELQILKYTNNYVFKSGYFFTIFFFIRYSDRKCVGIYTVSLYACVSEWTSAYNMAHSVAARQYETRCMQ